MPSLIAEYFYMHDKYTKKYGEKTIVLMQCGMFFEMYATEINGPNVDAICELLNIAKGRKDGRVAEITSESPYMIGFPLTSKHKFMKVLMENSYTVIVNEQITPPPNVTRKITSIVSSGTYIENSLSPDSNNIVSLYIESEEQSTSMKPLICVGMSVVDLTTGTCCVHEAYSSQTDDYYGLDEAMRFMNTYNPKELLITYVNNKLQHSMKKNDLIDYLEISNIPYHSYDSINKHFIKLSYQNEFFGKIYKEAGLMTPIEYLDMNKTMYASKSFIILLDYAFQHDETIINNLSKPSIFIDNKHMVLGNGAIQQLNIIDVTHETLNKKFSSLFDVVNNTNTPIGNRYLKERLTNPLIIVNELNRNYDHADLFIKEKLIDNIEQKLKCIFDTQRICRKISLQRAHQYEYCNLIDSYKQVIDIIDFLNKKKISNIVPEIKYINMMNEFLLDCEKVFNMDEMKKQNLIDITVSFFNKNIYPDIDKIQDELDLNNKFMQLLCNALSSYIPDTKNVKKKKKKNDNNNNDDNDDATANCKITIKHNDREGYYLFLSKIRASALKKQIEGLKHITVEGHMVDLSKLIFKDLPAGTSTKISYDGLADTSETMLILLMQLKKAVYDKYVEIMSLHTKKYGAMFDKINEFIGYVDFIKSNSKTALLYKYSRPKIVINKEHSFVKASKLRHPIIERIIDHLYIPHDITIGNDIKGIIVYGLNSAGKSSLMKATSLSLIMAQAGLFVPATEYEFAPYHSLFVRISGNDNMHKHLSSFALEMVELSAILKRSGPFSFFSGDEICRSTEVISATSIVSAIIIKLSQTKSSFIFTSHLHNVMKLDKIKQLTNIKACHLTVEHDKEKDVLIFDRKLKDGVGDEIYGITVAKHIIQDNEFISLAQEIKNILLNQTSLLLSTDTSQYNSNKYKDMCEVCNVKSKLEDDGRGSLDVHHLVSQCNFKNGIVVKDKEHVVMNDLSNLITVCKKCHNDIHKGVINVDSYIKTTDGKKLIIDQKVDVVVKKKKMVKSKVAQL